MKNGTKTLLSLMLLIAVAAQVRAADVSPDPYADETKEERDARMAWFREAKFGMFIHWGVYAVPAGTYKDKQVSGIGEWIMCRGKIPMAEYQAYAKDFNPVKYDPDAWVRLAKEAGMKYIVITSKHHDGFALFDSKVSEWDIVDATPYGKDLIAPLAEACRKHGMKLGLYYSQAQDWNQGGSPPRGTYWDPAQRCEMDEYVRDVAVPQVKEILTNYGPIAVLWWDTPREMTQELADQLLPLLKLQPGIIHNNRLFDKATGGDIKTPEQHIPATGLPGDWESCMTMNRTWGFKSYDHDWKSTETLIHNLVDIASKGGNYLLNVGPTAEGLIPQPSIQRLKEIGAWMKLNGESVYGTSASPFAKLAWGRCTKKLHDDGATLYLHVFEWPKNGTLLVPGLANKVSSARLLATGKNLAVEQGEDGVSITVPGTAPDPIDSVVVLEVAGDLEIVKPMTKSASDGSITFRAAIADVHNVGHGRQAKIETKQGVPNIGHWLDAQAWVGWRFKADRAGEYNIVADVSGTADSGATLHVGDEKCGLALAKTGSYDTFSPQALGTIRISTPGEFELAVRPVKDAWKPVNLRSITLRPVE